MRQLKPNWDRKEIEYWESHNVAEEPYDPDNWDNWMDEDEKSIMELIDSDGTKPDRSTDEHKTKFDEPWVYSKGEPDLSKMPVTTDIEICRAYTGEIITDLVNIKEPYGAVSFDEILSATEEFPMEDCSYHFNKKYYEFEDLNDWVYVIGNSVYDRNFYCLTEQKNALFEAALYSVYYSQQEAIKHKQELEKEAAKREFEEWIKQDLSANNSDVHTEQIETSAPKSPSIDINNISTDDLPF